MMGPRNDGRTGLTCPLSPSLTLSLSLYLRQTRRRGRPFKVARRKSGGKATLLLFPFSLLLPPPPSTSIGKVSLSRVVCTRTRTPYGGRGGGRGGERGSGKDGSGRTEEDRGRREAHKSTFLTPSEAGGRATNRPGAHQDSLILPFRVGRRPKPTMGSKDGGKGGRGK